MLHTLSHWYTLTVPTKLMEAEWILLPGLLRAYYQKEENKLKKKRGGGGQQLEGGEIKFFYQTEYLPNSYLPATLSSGGHSQTFTTRP